MGKSFLRVQFSRFLNFLMNCIMIELDEIALKQSAVVFSPHPDDETLGCGGTIIKKRMMGGDVTIVFMTDGSRSHRHLISEEELKSIRAGEALAASRVLGVDDKDLIFLEFKDGKLDKNRELAVSKVVNILIDRKPEEVFIPYYKEQSSWSEDHSATNMIVMHALQIYGKRAVIYEYPIGFWYQWPWVARRPTSSIQEHLNILKEGFLSSLSMLKDFRYFVDINEVLEIKREALDQYKSQMTRLFQDPQWQTLPNLSDGEFLACFFQNYEIFRRYNVQ
ncbi:MAG: PIG-L deacetylase family protein [Candidatus Bathyarchaeia archaeon]